HGFTLLPRFLLLLNLFWSQFSRSGIAHMAEPVILRSFLSDGENALHVEPYFACDALHKFLSIIFDGLATDAIHLILGDFYDRFEERNGRVLLESFSECDDICDREFLLMVGIDNRQNPLRLPLHFPRIKIPFVIPANTRDNSIHDGERNIIRDLIQICWIHCQLRSRLRRTLHT
ncbi:hypothetical protein PENTCL1PPCAC_19228, partial [Pristionchus entomophagus]